MARRFAPLERDEVERAELTSLGLTPKRSARLGAAIENAAHDRGCPDRSFIPFETKPPDATHWSSHGMARASGPSVSTVRRIWRAFGLQPHRLETSKLSTDPDVCRRAVRR